MLEMVLEQEQHQACAEIERLAAARAIELVLPAFALLEPHHTIVRRKLDRRSLYDGLGKTMQQLQRTASIAPDIPRLQDAALLLVRADQEASERFRELRTRLLEVGHVVGIDGKTLRAASDLTMEIDLELPDALMLATVLDDAKQRPSPSIFINRNTKDFDDPDVKALLRAVSCDLIGSFDDGLARIRNALEA
ncbi:MAG TPA: hypothetical protein VFK02_06425 [Kofleriaceae bacterium]|nr:hypothetical protein [Kofleriaceae bacterium]